MCLVKLRGVCSQIDPEYFSEHFEGAEIYQTLLKLPETSILMKKQSFSIIDR